jgi:hypothetical protein
MMTGMMPDADDATVRAFPKDINVRSFFCFDFRQADN